MSKAGSAAKVKLSSYDDLFGNAEEKTGSEEQIIRAKLTDLHEFRNHPFRVLDDEKMEETTESISKYGVLVPGIARPRAEGGYEIIAGHRRKRGSERAGKEDMPVIVRNYTDDEATIIMVDSNLQREQILPSEKAFAYKMKLDAMKRQAGRPSLENLTPVVSEKRLRTNEELGLQVGESREQIRRYIRLTHLIPEILELVDNSVLKDQEMLQIAMRPAVELSYLRKEEQADLFAIMDEMDCTPSHAQAIKMRQMSEAKTGGERLAKDALVSIMKEEKPNQKEQFKIPKEKISRFFAPGTPTQKIEDTIVKALELYRKRQRSLER